MKFFSFKSIILIKDWTNEIEEIMKSKNINDKNMDQITVIEKNKKLNVFSKVYFNEIKKKYFIQYY